MSSRTCEYANQQARAIELMSSAPLTVEIIQCKTVQRAIIMQCNDWRRAGPASY